MPGGRRKADVCNNNNNNRGGGFCIGQGKHRASLNGRGGLQDREKVTGKKGECKGTKGAHVQQDG